MWTYKFEAYKRNDYNFIFNTCRLSWIYYPIRYCYFRNKNESLLNNSFIMKNWRTSGSCKFRWSIVCFMSIKIIILTNVHLDRCFKTIFIVRYMNIKGWRKSRIEGNRKFWFWNSMNFWITMVRKRDRLIVG